MSFDLAKYKARRMVASASLCSEGELSKRRVQFLLPLHPSSPIPAFLMPGTMAGGLTQYPAPQRLPVACFFYFLLFFPGWFAVC